MALRWVVGRVPRCSDALHILVMYGSKTGRNCFRMSVGIGSSSHDFDGAAVITLTTSSSVQSWKLTECCRCWRKERCGQTLTCFFADRFYFLVKEVEEVLSWRNVIRQRFGLRCARVTLDRLRSFVGRHSEGLQQQLATVRHACTRWWWWWWWLMLAQHRTTNFRLSLSSSSSSRCCAVRSHDARVRCLITTSSWCTT